jgi:UDP-glucose:(heptosyl)LPS alpha-1,3-glucosyltransferase
LRLAFVLHHYFPHGGLQRDAWRIAEACQAAGHQVEFLTMAWSGPPLPGASVKFFPQKKMCNYQRDQAFSSAVQSYIQQYPYDGVIGFNKMPGLDIYYAADICFATAFAKRRWHQVYKFLPRYRHMLQAEEQVASIQSKTHLFLISPQAVTDFKNYYHTPKERLHFLAPGIARDRCWQTTSLAQGLEMRRHLGIKPKKKLILMLGSAFKTKGVDRGIWALAALPAELKENTELLIVGQGDQKPFRHLAEQLQVEKQVRFILGSDEVPALLFAADLLLHPAYVENTGTAILEAIVAGLPVLTTANCGYAFYVEQAQAGIVLPEPFVQEQLNQQLKAALTSTEYAQWQKNAVRFGQEHDLYSMPEQAARLITDIITNKSH